ncbi:MAG: T9SS type A sorting domain-containing protein [Bacteroidetes bacterium]|nr:T9SS type A sorting domain-containing protein [Bacteroidota bacterium]
MSQKTINSHIIKISHPLNDHVNSSVSKINIFLTDLQGQIIIEQQNVNWIDISNQPKGFYIAFLTDLQGGLIKKIRVIKE